EGQAGIVGDIAGDRAGGAAVAQLQDAGRDGRAAGVGVGTGQAEGARTKLVQSAGTADDVGVDGRIGAVEHQRRIVSYVARHRTGGSTIAELQGAGRDGGVARVHIGAG